VIPVQDSRKTDDWDFSISSSATVLQGPSGLLRIGILAQFEKREPRVYLFVQDPSRLRRSPPEQRSSHGPCFGHAQTPCNLADSHSALARGNKLQDLEGPLDRWCEIPFIHVHPY